MDHNTILIVSSIVNFVIFLGIIGGAVYAALPGLLVKRSEEVTLSMREAEADYKVAEEALSKWESNFKTSQEQITQLNEDAKATLVRLRQETMEAAERQAVRMQSDAKLIAASEQKKAQGNVLKELVDRSVRLVDEHLSQNLGDSEKKRLVTRSLESV